MTGKLREVARTPLILAATFVVLLFGLAAIVYAFLAARVNARNFAGFVTWALYGYALLMLVAVVPCLVLFKFKVRSLAAYVPAGILSGALAPFCWLFGFAIYENLWSLVHVVTASDGSGYDRTPPFSDILVAAFRYLPHIWAHDVFSSWLVSLEVAGIGAVCSTLIWLLLVWLPAYRARRRAQRSFAPP